jgi:hypothetical protein
VYSQATVSIGSVSITFYISSASVNTTAVTNTTVYYSSTNAVQTFLVPDYTTSLHVKLYGASGGKYNSDGGRGGFVEGYSY